MVRALTGAQRPTFNSVPPYVGSSGKEAIQLAAYAGLHLYPWQKKILIDGLGERPDGKWSAFEVATIVSRQNGKGAIFEARELAGLFLFGEKLIIHTAHEFKTSKEAFVRIRTLIENTPDLMAKVKSIKVGNNEQGIELKSGARLLFLARSGGSGRGFSCDCLILDEAMILGDDQMAAILPTMSARENPQVWYGSSAGIGDKSIQLARLRRRGLTGGDDSLAYAEWSVPVHERGCPQDCSDHMDMESPSTWCLANPTIGYRITPEFIQKERRTMSAAVFARERLGNGEYPVEEAESWGVIPQDAWRNAIDRRSEANDPVCIAIEVKPDRSVATVAAAGTRDDGRVHVEVIANRAGTGWVVDRVKDLVVRWSPVRVLLDPASPAGALIPDLEREEITLTLVAGRELAQACGAFYDGVLNDRIRHIDEPELNTAVASARKRVLADSWAWERRDPSRDITPLVAATLASHGITGYNQEDPEFFIDHM